jgi:nucleoside-diphosphate-sugar epimerase
VTTLVIGSGLVGSQVARILVERGEKPVLMDNTAQNSAINEIVDLAKVTLVAGDVLRPLSIVDVLRSHNISKIVHTAANPMLTVGVQKEPYSAINLNIMGTVNVLEAARVTDIKHVVVSSSSVLNYYLEGGEDGGDFGKEEAFPRRRSRSRISSAPASRSCISIHEARGRDDRWRRIRCAHPHRSCGSHA